MRKIKLLWDFRGQDSLEMAKHHCKHLKEFAQTDNLKYHDVNHEQFNELYSTAYIIIDETNMKIFRDALKPHRGELA